MAGVISTIIGFAYLIPSFVKEIYWLAVVGTLLAIFGLILVAISFGD